MRPPGKPDKLRRCATGLLMLVLLAGRIAPSDQRTEGPSWLPRAMADDGGDHDSSGGDHDGSDGGEHGDSGPAGDDGHDGGDDGPGGEYYRGDDDGNPADDGGEDETSDGRNADRNGRGREVPGEIVVLNEEAAFFDEVSELGFHVIAQQPLSALGITVTRLSLPARLTPAAAKSLLHERYPALLVDSNGLYRAQASLSLPPPNYPERLIGWGNPLPDCGRGIVVGLIDTRLAAGHPALAGRAIERRSFLAPDETPAPPGHGTAIAGILVSAGGDAMPSGLMPGATLRLAETFLLDDADQPAASAVGVAAALDWLVQTRTPVVNLSLAGADNLLLAMAVQRAAARGTVLVAAAGNDGPAGPAAYPAAYADVLAVAAVDQDLAPFTAGNQADYVDLAAPGVSIAVATPSGGLALVSGSSFAAPYVTAAAAMQIAKGVPAEPEAVGRALVADARDLGMPGHDPVYGWGLLQATAGCDAARRSVAAPQ